MSDRYLILIEQLVREGRSEREIERIVRQLVEEDRRAERKRAAQKRGYIRLRAYLPSASLSERISFVGRFKGGYRVWQIAH